MRIGIPRGFYFYLYPGLWEPFFASLGMETVLSEPSSRKILELAAPVSESEHCLAHKLFDGQLRSLEGRVDKVFIPRILSMTRGFICCAKFGALPDASRWGAAASIPVLSWEFNETKRPLKKALIDFARNLGAGSQGAKRAASLGIEAMEAIRDKQRRIAAALPPRNRFLLLGHPYTLEDPFISGPIIKKAGALGLPLECMDFGPQKLAPLPIRWCSFNKMYQRLQSLDPCCYGGVIQISTFNCGPDSVMADGYRRLCRERGLPFLLLMADEHAENTGLETRLEAFVDSIRWKRKKEGAPAFPKGEAVHG
jgi:predicted nucleotide-binding protein (sugar kinase/HSP70/actin superfamily)